MDIFLTHDLGLVDWEELASVIERAPLGVREPAKLRRAFENSFAVCFAFDDDKLIGSARAISDGEYHASIYDVVVLPEYQGRGVGSLMMDDLLARLPVRATILFAVPSKEDFYRKHGFARMLTAMGRFTNSSAMHELGYIDE